MNFGFLKPPLNISSYSSLRVFQRTLKIQLPTNECTNSTEITHNNPKPSGRSSKIDIYQPIEQTGFRVFVHRPPFNPPCVHRKSE